MRRRVTEVAPAGESPREQTDSRPDSPGAGQQALPRLVTEFPFALPRGYVDPAGNLHKEGVMRLATARDELLAPRDPRVRENPEYLSVVLLAQVIPRLGKLTDIQADVVEGMFAADVAFLQRLYESINADGETAPRAVCPECDHAFPVDMGSRLGE
ncbi:hypothetical protein I5Q34_33820 [Streptomyces sp. AV19]|uniref:hypothetical protein n=1 Tax=Streptomyces sp. AV19 TaxID=2793068 RepID=UPI0018FE2405|nr:hypothetical protein [Streptomyces sp. AV19]MBH1939180.1 hypothetical protein [Streptomyces sp. AV19]MDG4536910.1 hypothetical protein [Streptomyces sp. AV19]